VFKALYFATAPRIVHLDARDVTLGDHLVQVKGMPSGAKQPINAAMQHALRKELTEALAALPEAEATGTAIAKLAGEVCRCESINICFMYCATVI
jgi:hypothetical protein